MLLPMIRLASASLVLALIALPPVALAAREPCELNDPQRLPWFGDLHVHTALSLDAATQGTRGRPVDAYSFARGGTLGIQPYDASGNPMREVTLERPLDFAAVTDHAELFGELRICETPGMAGHDSFVCRLFRHWPRAAYYLMNNKAMASESPERFGFCGENGSDCRRAMLSSWSEVQAAAEQYYDRSSACSFTSFVGYEWTGSPNGRNLHRNIIFGSSEVPAEPASYVDAPSPRRLWDALERDCLNTGEGCSVVSIPHNSNLSGGLMFPTDGPDGEAMTADYARRRADFEPLVEMMQHKGDSECRIGAGEADEYCGFEKLPYDDFIGNTFPWLRREAGPMSFVRNALLHGLVVEDSTGQNPYRFGMIGGTDTHLAAAGAAEETSFPGHGGAGKPAGSDLAPGLPDNIENNPGGLVVLWAEENSRPALFAALRRRETYATSGPRILLRLFAAWELADDMCEAEGFAREGYSSGVPMGGVLDSFPGGASAPVIAVSAMADPGTVARPGTGLQVLQLVKGWLGKDGKPHSRVVDVAGDRDNGARVDTDSCEASGPGSGSLCSVWRDPDFDPSVPTFYYARVIENPVCRWSTVLCNQADIDCAAEGAIAEAYSGCCDSSYPRVIQERAWSSPVWYKPASRGMSAQAKTGEAK